jgi:hypothetical protein
MGEKHFNKLVMLPLSSSLKFMKDFNLEDTESGW